MPASQLLPASRPATYVSRLKRCDKKVIGGWGGIRTHEELAPLAVFKTAAFNRSATHPTAEFRHPAENGTGPPGGIATRLPPGDPYHAMASPAKAALIAAAAFVSLSLDL